MSDRDEEYRLQGPVSFFLMSLEFRLRDLFRPPVKMLQAVWVKPGQTVLDYGCGPGSFTFAAARIVGPNGKVYAVDINPIAQRVVMLKALKRKLDSVIPLPPCDMYNIPNGEVDVTILYDVLHDLTNPPSVFNTFHKVTKPEGILAVSDHHMTEQAIISAVVSGRLFRLARRCAGHKGVLCFERSQRE